MDNKFPFAFKAFGCSLAFNQQGELRAMLCLDSKSRGAESTKCASLWRFHIGMATENRFNSPAASGSNLNIHGELDRIDTELKLRELERVSTEFLLYRKTCLQARLEKLAVSPAPLQRPANVETEPQSDTKVIQK
ncbi:MAG: hypothetical protein L0Y58_20535 [Verrucomicrobia subdivision 3 bacterium]|nr:hypothetical protein [Limisphaerales bacterium]